MKNIRKQENKKKEALYERMENVKNYKHREIMRYLIIGVLTTVVYFLVRFSVFSLVQSGLLSVVVAQIAAILFAFATNKWFVFQNQAKDFQELCHQFVLFCLARGFVFLLDIGITLLTVEWYSAFFIDIMRLEQLDYTTGLFTLPLLKPYIGNPITLNAFIFALVTQILAIMINYVLSKYLIFKKEYN